MKPTKNTDAKISETGEIPDRTPGAAMKAESAGKAKPRGHHTLPTKWTASEKGGGSGSRG